MARIKNNIWNNLKYKLNGLIIILPFYFLYQSLFPVFPDAWTTKAVGEFQVTPLPYNLEPPYLHHGSYTKDFMLTFSQGNINHIRQAYLNIGKSSLPLTSLQRGDEGILHGSKHGQEVHAISSKILSSEDKVWLTIEDWKGQVMKTSWELPKELLQ